MNGKHVVYLGLGSNLGNKKKNIQLALDKIQERIGEVTACSAFFTTEPIGFESPNLFVNAACRIETRQSPEEVLAATQQIEREMGRTSKSYNKVYTDRIIDIDILLYDSLIVDTPDLVLPHPYLHERDFVLLPLAEVAGEVIHPTLKKTISELKSNR
ncbi:2-amino-4-hydroxy-6-hydroxymethyldihydropteridine diphosphokinase [Dysgonomonas sp. 25]|uniref:2-amino-4-hydroxy-6- hydroxymethyldihydropteridine diphosphokinase n=1 Tax=Dysgonomonas sp. 25 TaxID=2302933 RepID=UPI0013D6D6E1|nr:2-amino-4-hydroxy-6-hydroxymethyldihydropteridine diphosphokinase [Dysgonomonas sp. 25]NDV68271.1 2-amino-4-hydroxy-6-hydroxymethyldihydropteridine diphosphokinase [Dysgonomonas sp. 25]